MKVNGMQVCRNAGDHPDDTLRANEEGSYVSQRWAAFLRNTKQVVEVELRDKHNQCLQTVSASGGARLSAHPVRCRQHQQEHLHLGRREG
jgi:hypothetical protein